MKRLLACFLAVILMILSIPLMPARAAGKVIPADGSRVLVGVNEWIERVGNNLSDDNRIISHAGSQSGYLLENFRSNYSISFLIDVQEAGYYEFYVRMAIGSTSAVGRYRIDIMDPVTKAVRDAATFNEMTGNGVWNNSFVESRVPLYLQPGEQILRLNNIHTQAFNVDGIAIKRYIPPVVRADGMPVTIEAEHFISGVRTSTSRFSTLNNQTQASNGWYLGNFDAGHSVTYKVNAHATGNYEFGVWVASTNNSLQFEISGDGKTVTSDIFNTTGAWSTYLEKKVVLPLTAGEHDITIKNLAGTWNMDRFTMHLIVEPGQLYDIAPYATAAGTTTGDASKIIDGNDLTGWQATGTVGQAAVIRYNAPVSVDSVVLFDLPGSHITSGKLTFSNGKSFAVGEILAMGTEVKCAQNDIYWVRFDILSADASTTNAGLQQIKLMGQINLQSTKMDVGMDGTILTGTGLVYMTEVLTGFSISNGRISLTFLKEEAFNEIQLMGLPAGNYEATISLDNGTGKQISFVANADGFASVDIGGINYATSISLSISGLTGEKSLQGVVVIGPSVNNLPLYRDYHNVYVFVRYWNSLPDDTYLYINNNTLSYRSVSLDPVASSRWTLIANANGDYTVQNEDGRYMVMTSSQNAVSFATTLPSGDGGLWTLQAATSPYIRFVSKAYPTRKINIESLNGTAQATTTVQDSWYSAMWQFKTSLPPQPWDHWYEIGKNSIIGTAGMAIATSDTSIMSNASGSSRTWSQLAAYNPLDYPQFTSDNTMANAVYNLTMQEV